MNSPVSSESLTSLTLKLKKFCVQDLTQLTEFDVLYVLMLLLIPFISTKWYQHLHMSAKEINNKLTLADATTLIHYVYIHDYQ